MLAEKEILYDVKYEASDSVEANHIISTEPEANTEISKDDKIILVVSMEGSGVNLMSVIGYSKAEARSMLEDDGFVVEVEEEYNSGIPKGNVVSQNPEAGSSIARGATIKIVVSLGAETSELTMPDLTNMTEDAARKTLEGLGLILSSVSEEYNDDVDPGLVCYQSYTYQSSIKEGTEIEIKLSLGPEPKYYNCNIKVDAPANYSGGNANVVLKAMDGTELFNTMTSSFPVDIILNQIYAVPKGTVYITYTVYVDEEGFDEFGNPTLSTVAAQDTYSYEVTFTQ
ncbi:MAG: PASTA domain-containing protein [Lachnospiraceae bacterium]|nr:PASTA domain-containing protein [Lachnospiraceae bacterium]